MIRGVRSVALGSTNLLAAERFYTEVWSLTVVHRDADSVYLRGTSGYHHILSLHRADQLCVLNVTFDGVSVEAVDRLYQSVAASGVPVSGRPQWASGPAKGYGFAFRDPEGRGLQILADAADGPDATVADKVTKITHVNVNCADKERSFNFYTQVLGFSLIDEGAYRFLHCDSMDHSAIILAPSKAPTLNHIAFELPTLECVMRGTGRMKAAGYPTEWGIGRHGPADNVFAYFAGPEELPIEYTSEVQQVDSSYEPHGPDYWRQPPGKFDQWGITGPRSARFDRIKELVPFDESERAFLPFKQGH